MAVLSTVARGCPTTPLRGVAASVPRHAPTRSKPQAEGASSCSALVAPFAGFLISSVRSQKSRKGRKRCLQVRSLADEFSLPDKLAAAAMALRSLPSDRLRCQQLLALAGKLPAMPADLKVPENKVPGCLSTVHVHATLNDDDTVTFEGDSDALISKGLVALLVIGLSGCSRSQLMEVDPEFIKASGITASLTPGRNNGFFNMFKLMKAKVAALSPAEKATEEAAPEEAALEEAAQPALRIYDTLSREKRAFKSIKPGVVNLYACGVTVYDLCHLGHARIMVFFDLVSRYLRSVGYDVKFVRNVTDIDDKIIKRANELGETPESLARRMEEEMQRDAASLLCQPPTVEPRVSETMPEILEMVKTLVEKEHAYPADPESGEGKDVYFRVRSFKDYGRLSGVKIDENQAGVRKEVGGGKTAPEDFALWKAAKEGEPSWESPWGPGRPGWHIECSAMSKKHLGTTLDIHGGGPDLVFPHHENEIAQSECANCTTYANTWMHVAALRSSSGEEKMSKSLGNFVTIRDVLEKYDGETMRLYLLSSQYRQPLLYNEESLPQAKERMLRLYSALRGLKLPEGSPAQDTPAWTRFHGAMCNDFDTVNAFAVINEVARDVLRLRQEGAEDEALQLAWTLKTMGGLLGLLQRDPEEVLRGGKDSDEDKAFAERVEGLIADRVAARKAKDWARADEIRDELNELSVVLEDTAEGTVWRVAALVS